MSGLAEFPRVLDSLDKNEHPGQLVARLKGKPFGLCLALRRRQYGPGCDRQGLLTSTTVFNHCLGSFIGALWAPWKALRPTHRPTPIKAEPSTHWNT
jgi:hypothetical protein